MKDKIAELHETVQNGNWPEEKKQTFMNYQDYLVATGKSERTRMPYSLHIQRLGNFSPGKKFRIEREQIAGFKLIKHINPDRVLC